MERIVKILLIANVLALMFLVIQISAESSVLKGKVDRLETFVTYSNMACMEYKKQ